MSIVQKDISNLESQPELPDTYLKEGDFLRVKTDGSGDTEWFDTNTGTIVIGTGLFSDGTQSVPSIAFQNDTNTGIYRLGEDDLGITTGGVTRLAINGSSVEVGTLSNNLNFNVNGNSSAINFRAGNGTIANPSYAFSTSGGNDTGMFYLFDTIDRLRFSAGGTNTLEMNAGQCFFNNRLLANGTGTNTTPALIFHNDSNTTGYSGQRTNPSTDPRLWAVVNGVQATELTPTQFNIGLNTSNNTNMKTLNQNGASNFNSFTPAYSSFITPQTAIGTIGQALSGVDFDGTNYVVSIAGTAVGNRLWVSQNLSTWTAINDTQISLGNSNVQFGNGIWCYLSRVSGQRQLWTSTAPATTWTQIGSVAPWTTNRQCNRLKFINGQFIILCNTSFIRFSSDGLNWTEYSINATSYTLNDITYSPELQRYVIVTVSAAILHFSGNTITNTSAFIAVTTNVEQANGISYSPKYGRFLFHGNANNQRYYISNDGINWSFYTNPINVTNSNNTIWINDFGGFFLDIQFNRSEVAVSRDGLSFQVIPNNLTLNSVNCVYNSTGKVLLIVGSSGSWGTFRNMLTDFNNYIDSDNIYNTFNSNIRFTDVIEYQNQVITPATGNNYYTISQFNRPEVVFDTNAVNANIYLQGSSFNGRVGCKFKFIKRNTGNNVIIHGYETTTLISPTGNVSSFNAQSSPQTYSIIPVGYFGSFELSRVSDAGNGVWVIDNVDVYNSSGTTFYGNTIIEGKVDIVGSQNCNIDVPVYVSGSFSARKPFINEWTGTSGLTVESSNFLTWADYTYISTISTNFYIQLYNLNNAAFDNSTLYFCGSFDNSATNFYIGNQMGTGNIVIVYKSGSYTQLTNAQDTTIDKHQWVRCTYKHNYRSSNNYWLVHEYSS